MSQRSEQLHNLALAMLLAIGAGTAWVFLGTIVCGTLASLLQPIPENHAESITILEDGTPLIVSSHFDGASTTISFRTLDGQRFDRIESLQKQAPQWSLGDHKIFNKESPKPSLSMMQRFQKIPAEGYRGEHWYFVHDGKPEGHGYFVGYDARTRYKIGCIGRDGFTAEEPDVNEQFPVNARKVSWHCAICYWNPSPSENFSISSGNMPDKSKLFSQQFLLLADDGLVLVNLSDRTAKMVLHDDTLISVDCSGGIFAVRSKDKIRLLDPEGVEQATYPIPEQLRKIFALVCCQLLDHSIVLFDNENDDITWLDASGKIVRQENLTLQHDELSDWLSPSLENLVLLAAYPSPLVIFSGITYDAWSHDDFHRFKNKLSECGAGLSAITIISVVLAVFCFRRHRKYGLPWTWGWTVFVLLFGVPAYLGYLVHRKWAARPPCPNCGKPAPRDRDACFACGHDFPSPDHKGIEVFA